MTQTISVTVTVSGKVTADEQLAPAPDRSNCLRT